MSGKTPDALRAQAARLLEVVERGEVSTVDLAWSLATGRAALDHRAVVPARDRDDLAAGLRRVAIGESVPVVGGR
ncbi:hypothetical protein K7G98_43370, partial [Saccharothrix sp. MB29]|nr:hypothetical protein [Saccharothrix sp. MB29]